MIAQPADKCLACLKCFPIINLAKWTNMFVNLCYFNLSKVVFLGQKVDVLKILEESAKSACSQEC